MLIMGQNGGMYMGMGSLRVPDLSSSSVEL